MGDTINQSISKRYVSKTMKLSIFSRGVRRYQGNQGTQGATGIVPDTGDYKGLLWRLRKLVPIAPFYPGLSKYIGEAIALVEK